MFFTTANTVSSVITVTTSVPSDGDIAGFLFLGWEVPDLVFVKHNDIIFKLLTLVGLDSMSIKKIGRGTLIELRMTGTIFQVANSLFKNACCIKDLLVVRYEFLITTQ